MCDKITFFDFVLIQYIKILCHFGGDPWHPNLYLIYRIYIFHISDINECTAGTDDCSANAACTNTDGGFDCTCNTGFTDTHGDGTQCDGKLHFGMFFSIELEQ